MTSSICTKFAHFWVVLVRKCMVQKVLISYRFDFFDFFSAIFWWFRTSFFIVFVQNWMVRNESVLLLSQNGNNEILIGAKTGKVSAGEVHGPKVRGASANAPKICSCTLICWSFVWRKNGRSMSSSLTQLFFTIKKLVMRTNDIKR